MKGDSRVIGALTQCPLFYGRPIHALVPTCTVRHYADGEPLYRPGDNASHLVVLLAGRAELLDAAEHVVHTYRVPDSFGEAGLFAHHRRRNVTARAVGDVDAVLVPRDALLHAAAGDVVINERLLTALADAAEPAPPVDRRGPAEPGRPSGPRREGRARARPGRPPSGHIRAATDESEAVSKPNLTRGKLLRRSIAVAAIAATTLSVALAGTSLVQSASGAPRTHAHKASRSRRSRSTGTTARPAPRSPASARSAAT